MTIPDPIRTEIAEALCHLAADLRSAGDVDLVLLDEDGVAPADITLADELWLYALRLDPDVACRKETPT